MSNESWLTPADAAPPVRVVIVDDTLSIRSMLSALLASQGYQVVAEVEEGNAVMDVVRQHKPDIVCLDYQLPGRDGLDILHEINETLPDIDVIFMTASEDADIEAKVADAGAAGFIRKPFAQTHIVAELNQVSETRRKAQAATAANEKQAKPAPGKPAAGRANKRDIVIVDDNASIRLLLKGLFTGLGLNVVRTAGNGKEGVTAAETYQPAILCLDVDMPIMTGFEALPKIREVSPHTTVVMVTANATKDFVQKAISLGAKGYFIKPIRPAHIEAFVKKLLDPVTS